MRQGSGSKLCVIIFAPFSWTVIQADMQKSEVELFKHSVLWYLKKTIYIDIYIYMHICIVKAYKMATQIN